MMYPVLVHIHSLTRWLLLAGLVASLLLVLSYWLFHKPGFPGLKKLFSATGGMAHLQLLFGLVLYFVSPRVVFSSMAMKDAATRFFTMEHITMMLLAVVLITIGMIVGRRISNEKKAVRRVFVYFLAAFILIVVAIPWPWGPYAGGWY